MSEPPHIVRTVQKRGLQGVEQAIKDWPGEARAEPGQSLSEAARGYRSGCTRRSDRWPAEMS